MFKSVVKVCGSTVKLQLILDILSAVEAGGIRGVAVKCLDNTLLEIANQLAADQTALGSLVLALDAAIRTDIVQAFTDAQKTQAQENMGVTASTMMASYTAAKAAAMV